MLYWYYHPNTDGFFISPLDEEIEYGQEECRRLGEAINYSLEELKGILKLEALNLLQFAVKENVSFNIAGMKLKRPIVFFDLETTGLDPSEDRIVQIAMLKVMPGDEAPIWYKSYVYPEIPIKDEAMEMHRITVATLLENDAPRFELIAEQVAKFFIGCDIAGYNVMGFDFPLLQTELQRYGQDLVLKKHRVFDVFLTYKNIGGYKLGDCYRMIMGKDFENAHDAEADTQATFEVAVEMLRKYPEAMGESIKQWEESGWKREEFVEWDGRFKRIKGEIVFTFGTHKGELIKNHAGYLKWMLKESFRTTTKAWIRGYLESIKA